MPAPPVRRAGRRRVLVGHHPCEVRWLGTFLPVRAGTSRTRSSCSRRSFSSSRDVPPTARCILHRTSGSMSRIRSSSTALDRSAMASTGSGVPGNPGTCTVTKSAHATICVMQNRPARSTREDRAALHGGLGTQLRGGRTQIHQVLAVKSDAGRAASRFDPRSDVDSLLEPSLAPTRRPRESHNRRSSDPISPAREGELEKGGADEPETVHRSGRDLLCHHARNRFRGCSRCIDHTSVACRGMQRRNHERSREHPGDHRDRGDDTRALLRSGHGERDTVRSRRLATHYRWRVGRA